MKKLFYLFLLAFTVEIQAQAPPATASQNDPRAEEILAAVSKKYQAIPAFRASFTYALESTATGAKENYPGEVTVKGSKYRLRMGGQEVINNGTTVWTYLKESNEVNISDYQPDEEEITPTKIFSVYKQGYKYVFSNQTKEKGVVYEVVDLIPDNRNSQVFKVRLTVNKKDKTIRSTRVFEKNGNRSIYTITKFAPDDSVEDKLFVFDKAQYKGVEIIDLR